MGVAAYNRASKVIRQRITGDPRPVEFELMERWNAIKKLPDAGTPFSDLQIMRCGKYWIIECPIAGYSYWYKTINELMSRWRVTIIGCNNGVFIATPIKETV